MLQRLAKFLWTILPQKSRLRLVRLSQPTFTVSVAAIVFDYKGKVLLLKHVLRTTAGWGLPGGFINKGEQPESAIRREIHEETGLELENLEIFLVRTMGQHIEILFSATANGEGRVLSREITQLGWFSPEMLPSGLLGGQETIIHKARKKMRFDNFSAAD
jgi:ADP-ribose pyrophosphatase YjhB (NUDIX family)